MTTYNIFGLQVTSELPLASFLQAGQPPADLTIRRVAAPPLHSEWEHLEPLYRSPYRTRDGNDAIRAYRVAGFDVLRLSGVADYYLRGADIACLMAEGAEMAEVEIGILGTVLACWLSSHAIPSLHASAVEINGHAALFLATNKGGKTSLAASLTALGHPLLTDDLLPLEERDGAWWGRPGYPQMRMWPDAAAHFVGAARAEALPTVHPRLSKRRVPVGAGGIGRFAEGARPLGVIYLPERRDAGDPERTIAIETMSPRDAVIELLRHSFAVRLVSALQSPQERLNRLALLAEQVPMRRLRYPHGYELLADVRDALLADVASVTSRE